MAIYIIYILMYRTKRPPPAPQVARSLSVWNKIYFSLCWFI